MQYLKSVINILWIITLIIVIINDIQTPGTAPIHYWYFYAASVMIILRFIDDKFYKSNSKK
ncbi:MAG: hypothetical protein A3I07_01645 [Candidatus Doudnabacteria bacterium RIFCSPLOWO2_02_FULL_42_9]|uniref:Uncharacterized protein n=1 Tax=Candidatus Doudnabacteria bacterium RIFCSPHIGHO2_01_FULL_41_86 TaxID=1817821 RepID=A0A1F5N7W1_9BACT|nr:MAG: hypothetical protein A2717_03510 [Candidatus Doudnabacteria bacterium RIFCSPHIGHO2_01_FULL_41_86]OGE74743.1 MAG: hypothetical protein A3K07_03110 [Candidatus Doudnabacteria bacterium RIFCSPHIGHO2_01_43_10]OGE85709.1 MAG: hypothetical protein A3E28_02840 [Candidatus Doudnabacteria bacterium RIFCSPHIGHO2_12_FULL_42_22]OGE87205.1 MAG: hypothetical protein A3C49_00470 [Candidatus Doudnabacteria bacterium RIFCSPHIGHO2_02_FULL_42_25]OGE92042.1 MAG: hypothetical protein A2895_00345 [Candidatus